MKSSQILLATAFFLIAGCSPDRPVTTYQLWYEQPATYFEETLVMGNGKMGASIFGGVEVDSIYLNDLTLWSGEPLDLNENPDAHEYVPLVRAALEKEDYREADRLIRNIQGPFSQSYAPLGTLYFHYGDEEAENYQRTLNISDAISSVSYQVGDAHLTRKYFVSHPDQVMVVRLESDQAETLDFSVGFSSLLKFRSFQEDGMLKIEGYAPYNAEPSYRGGIENPVSFDENRGTRFANYIAIKNTDGQVSLSDSTLSLTGGSYAEILVSVATSFNGFDKDPATEGKPWQNIAQQQVEDALALSFDQLQANHLEDYHSYFDRMQLRLQESDSLTNLPTDRRLMRYAEGKPDKGLEELYFHFGRYLLISSSRTPEVPANLQGIWNHYLLPPWSSNYTVNINVEENYWLAEVANLSELHTPLLGFIENLAETGAVTAQNYYGAGGWTVAHNSDIWALSNPIGESDPVSGNPLWSNWNMGGVWLSTHLWEHYLFTQDREFLTDKAYPLMKGAAQFCLDWMIQDEHGHWITSPATSPENQFLLPDGYQGAVFYGATADLAMIRELFLETIAASEVLGEDESFRQMLQDRLDNLHPYQIGAAGNLQEWYYDWKDADPQHRHQTHLFGLHPGHHISPESTPELAAACETTLNIKGDVSTGWSQGWRINLWARLKDGNRAYKLYKGLLRYVDPSGQGSWQGGGTYPNLLDAHPPFQIDGNFGGAAGVLEMLVQSSEDQIEVLPALPDGWPSGEIDGVKTRGGYELAFKWTDGKVSDVRISSRTGGATTLVYEGKEFPVSLKAGEEKSVVLGG